MGPIAAVVAIAAVQRGALSVPQARAAGLTPRAQRAAIERGWLRLGAAGVLVVSGSEDSWYQRIQIGLLSLGGDGWVSHETAATLLRFDRCLDEPLHFTVGRDARRRLRDVPPWMTVHTTALLQPADVILVQGFRCTSATRTILDLATLGIPTVRLEASIDSAIRNGHSALVVLAERLGTLRGSGRAGVRTIDRLLPDSGVESMLERRFLRLLRRHGLPRPTTQHVVRNHRRHVARVDFLYDELRLVVEVTGRKGHVSDAERARDAQRRNELQALGHVVIEYTSTDVRDRPRYVVDSLRRRLTERSRPPSATGPVAP